MDALRHEWLSAAGSSALLQEAHQVARGITDGAIAYAVRLTDGLPDDLDAAGERLDVQRLGVLPVDPVTLALRASD